MSAAGKSDRDLALDSHRYRLPNGELATSVTTISGLMDLGKSMGFAYAAVKLAQQGLSFRDEWNASGDRGTRIHGHLESFLKGESIDQAPDEEGYVDALEKFLADHDPTLIEQEFIVLSNRGYGGRADLLCRIGDRTLLIDAKSGKTYPTEHTLQLAAYRYADGIATYADDGSLSTLRPLPPIDAAAALYVHEDGTYDLREYPADLDAFRAFCALLEAHRWTKTEVVKAAEKEGRGR